MEKVVYINEDGVGVEIFVDARIAARFAEQVRAAGFQTLGPRDGIRIPDTHPSVVAKRRAGRVRPFLVDGKEAG